MSLFRTVKACVVAGLAVGLVMAGVAVPVGAQSGVTLEMCLRSHSSPAGDFVTVPFDVDGDGIADTCALANYFGPEPGVGSALKRLQDAHAVEYQCHLSAVRAGQPSNCQAQAAESEQFSDLELLDFENGIWLTVVHPVLAASLEELPWVRDGLDANEAGVVQTLLHFATDHIELVEPLSSFGWLADGVTDDERTLIQYLSWLGRNNRAAVESIIREPFLASVEPHDIYAVLSLWRLSENANGRVEAVLERVNNNGAITDYWARIIPVVGGTNEQNRRLVNRLLRPEFANLEFRIVHLPISGEVELVIIRTDSSVPEPSQSMDHLEDAVRTLERYMDAALPINYVVLLFEEAVLPDSIGTNFRTHITVVPELDVTLPHEAFLNEFSHDVIAHEVGHFYFAFDAVTWLNEGTAEFLAQLSVRERFGTPITMDTEYCPHRTLERVERIPDDAAAELVLCNYILGENLFVDLYRTLGEQRFMVGMQDLYLILAHRVPGTTLAGLAEVRAAFGAEAGNAADRVINRWYYGT